MKIASLFLPVALALFFAFAPARREQRSPDVRRSGSPEVDGLAAGLPDVRTPGQSEGWRVFSGSWSASGERQTLPTEGARLASTVYLSGAVVMTGGAGMSRGFRGEVIGFDDGASVSAARAVWTDERGDRIFSTLKGETIGAGRRFAGTITGGTGRYAGIVGEYSFEWQYVIEADQGAIQGKTSGLEGRFRTKEAGR